MSAVEQSARPVSSRRASARALRSVISARPIEHASTLVVTTLSATFGVVLLEASGILATVVTSDEVIGSDGTVRVALSSVTSVFSLIALYVAAIVTANTFATVISGRTGQIALLRLVGAQASSLRRAVAAEGLVVGAIGAILGMLLGVAITLVTITVTTNSGWLPALDYTVFDPIIAVPVVVVALTTAIAAWVGSRAVTRVSPLAATGAAAGTETESTKRRTVRSVLAIVAIVGGGGLLALGVAVGFVSPAGVLIAAFGGGVSFTGVIVGAPMIMPVLLRLVGGAFGRSPAARIAALNAVRSRERSTRATIGLVIGVTLVTLFAVAMESYRAIILDGFSGQPALAAAVDQSLTVTSAIFAGLVGFSAVIAAVGMVNNLSMSVLQRRRELGLLRVLGFTTGQVRRMILAESAQMTIAAIVFGLVLGVIYGWAAAQSLFGSIANGLVAPAVPASILIATVVASAVLTFVAAVAPARRATRVAPVVALAAA